MQCTKCGTELKGNVKTVKKVAVQTNKRTGKTTKESWKYRLCKYCGAEV